MSNKLELELAQLRAENEALKAAQAALPAPTLKISEKGCVTMLGIRQPYGVSFYPTEWERLFSQKENVQAFIQANRAELTARGQATRAVKAQIKAAVAAAAPAAAAAAPVAAVPMAPPGAGATQSELMAYYTAMAAKQAKG